MKYSQPYIHSVTTDWVFILSPPLLISVILLALPDTLVLADLNPWLWLLLVVGIDVSHVYSTLYQTYWNKTMYQRLKTTMHLVPLLSLALSIALYTAGKNIFWSCLAYLAVFHFVRQQYGFMRIYARKEKSSKVIRILEGIIIYACSLYPMLYWHIGPERNFHWFIDGDFIQPGPMPILLNIASCVYILILISWLGIMAREWRHQSFNLPKHTIVFGTAISWYLGIVYFNGDLAFAALNIVSHGIPYMALIWMRRREENNIGTSHLWKHWGLPIFLLSVLVFAFAEEFLWDVLHWREHALLFGWAYALPVLPSIEWQALAVPLLALPQITHYILDGFIWRKTTSTPP